MGQFLRFNIKSSFLWETKNLFDEIFDNSLKNNKIFKESNHYLICRTKSLKFFTRNLSIQSHFILKFKLVVAGIKTETFKVDIRDLLEGEKFSLSKKEIKEDEIYILNDLGGKYIITPEILETKFELLINNQPEIIYIGKSINLINRLTKAHKHIQLALSRRKDYENIRVYAIKFEYSYAGTNQETNTTYLLGNINTKMLDIKMDNSLFELVERVLIHFFKPELNILHKQTNIKTDKRLQELVIDKNLNGVIFSYGMKEQAYQFKSKYQVLKNETITLDTRVINYTYLPEVDLSLIFH